ncbi:tripartite tricarboxylate transporter TctB family protein [Sphaerochaeta sp. PS]|uniref:tripartite tricarboxylate transporter TctB family protein n=1 Tax=Sphaerochaeta sp. PS TaxID=3076336 RepID=UPI0028A41A54|nr:tripartite tricarboxylate transporter TctB family protein [Sphaerochaeta sp. PS]MDT4763173.1 tripartite tricarboxylate transporter TctB family protein [Sphaerochaeta sp. PS]
MNKELKKELGVGIFFAALSFAYLLGTTFVSTFSPFGNRGLDSKSVPMLIGGLALVLSASLIISTCIKYRQTKATTNLKKEQVCDSDEVVCIAPPDGVEITDKTKKLPVKMVLSVVFLVLYFALYQRIGFILSSIFYLIAEIFLLTEKQKRKKWALFIILFSIGVTVLIYVVFTRYLTLFLPRGILG